VIAVCYLRFKWLGASLGRPAFGSGAPTEYHKDTLHNPLFFHRSRMRTPRNASHTHAEAPSEAQASPQRERPSKSQIKRDMHALLDLGKALVALSDDKLKRLPLSEALYDAIRMAQRISSREARRRQIHYVGKLMRQAPAQDIQAQLHAWKHGIRAAPTTPTSPTTKPS